MGVFSLIGDSNQSIQPPIITNTSRTLSLKDICHYDYDANGYARSGNSAYSSEFLFDFLSLFILATIARYRPTTWRQITAGKGSLLSDSLGVLGRFKRYPPYFHYLLDNIFILKLRPS